MAVFLLRLRSPFAAQIGNRAEANVEAYRITGTVYLTPAFSDVPGGLPRWLSRWTVNMSTVAIDVFVSFIHA